jgi:hypothetical protein
MTQCETPLASKSFEQFLDQPGDTQASPPAAAHQSKPQGMEKDNEVYIILPGGAVSITEAAGKIFTLIARERDLFYRGGRVHEVVLESTGTSRLNPITPVHFRSRLECYGRVLAWRSGANGEPVLKPTNCPEEMAKALLESIPAREHLPNISILSACPVLANDNGTAHVLGPGWHSLCGGLIVTGGVSPPSVPLAKAVDTLCSLLSDFDFPSLGDRSRALASLIAPGLRFGSWLTDPLPVDIGEADASQSGKTYRQKLVAAIYREKCNVVVQRSGGVGGLDESLSQKLIDGRPFVLFDNLRGKLDSPFFESILTAHGPMPARVPHKGEVQVDPRGFVFQITSNGVEITPDLASRASITRIRKHPAAYPFKVYDEGYVYAHIVANQAYYLGCVFAVINEWVCRGRPRTGEMRHDFREWAQTLDWIVQNIFQAAPLMDGHDDAKQRVSDPRQTWLRALCIALRASAETGEFNATRLAEFCMVNNNLPPNIRQGVETEDLARAIGRTMAKIFESSDERDIDGFKIRRSFQYSQTAQKECPFYRFEEPGASAAPREAAELPKPTTQEKQTYFSESSNRRRQKVVRVPFQRVQVAPTPSPLPAVPSINQSAAQNQETEPQPVGAQPESAPEELVGAGG